MLEIILVQGFCPLKIKITQFPDGFHHNLSSFSNMALLISKLARLHFELTGPANLLFFLSCFFYFIFPINEHKNKATPNLSSICNNYSLLTLLNILTLHVYSLPNIKKEEFYFCID